MQIENNCPDVEVVGVKSGEPRHFEISDVGTKRNFWSKMAGDGVPEEYEDFDQLIREINEESSSPK